MPMPQRDAPAAESLLWRFKTRAYIETRRVIGQWALFLAPYIPCGFDPAVRNVLPEPVNVFNHAANMELSAAIGFGVGAATHKAYAAFAEKGDNPKGALRKARAAMAVGGLVVGVAVNALTETRLGISLSHIANTPDPLDLVYGAVSASIAAATGPSLQLIPAESRQRQT